MKNLSQALKDAGFGERVFSDRQLGRITGEGDARRYGLVNRALKDGSLIRIKRGLYCLADKGQQTVHPYTVAQALKPGSYVSFESALSRHGWIPEGVFTTTSVTPDRKSLSYETQAFGLFSFRPVAVQPFGRLVSVDRLQLGPGVALVAQPLRALMDLVAIHKADWAGIDFLTTGLRIEPERLAALCEEDFDKLRAVYKHKKVQDFLNALESEVAALTEAQPGKRRLRP